MPHPSEGAPIRPGGTFGDTELAFGHARVGVTLHATFGGLGHVGGQVVIRHDRSTTKKKRLRQRQRVR